MVEFTIKLAGIPIRITALYDSSRTFCEKFLCDEEPVLKVLMTPELLEAERSRSGEAGMLSSERYLENLAIYRQIAEQMIDHNALLFHSSAIAVDGVAYLFAAPSGTGKSTHTRLWRQVLPELGHEVVMVNDDKPLIRFDESGVYICGTPWNGKHRLGTNCEVRIGAICNLIRGETNEIRRLPVTSAWQVMLRQCYRGETGEHLSKELKMLNRLFTEVPMYELRCNMEPEAALVSYEGMREKLGNEE